MAVRPHRADAEGRPPLSSAIPLGEPRIVERDESVSLSCRTERSDIRREYPEGKATGSASIHRKGGQFLRGDQHVEGWYSENLTISRLEQYARPTD